MVQRSTKDYFSDISFLQGFTDPETLANAKVIFCLAVNITLEAHRGLNFNNGVKNRSIIREQAYTIIDFFKIKIFLV